MDGGSDGSVEDMWRYAIDAAAIDWASNNDHDNGGGKEYSWWLAQKTTDLYNSPRIAGMFSYERSNGYPHGHRNVMFARRGVRTLPRLVNDRGVVDADTRDALRLPEGARRHLRLTFLGHGHGDRLARRQPGIRADRRDLPGPPELRTSTSAPLVSPVARARQIGGWRPLGMVWNALAMQYRLGFQASSDHISTHISYAIAIAESAGREAVFDAFKQRHCYGATDNIVLDVRSGDHIMGDEFQADGPVRLKVCDPRHAPDRPGGHHQGLRLRLLYRARPPERGVRVAGRGASPGRPELVLRPRPPGRRRDRLGQPLVDPHTGHLGSLKPLVPTRLNQPPLPETADSLRIGAFCLEGRN